MAKSKDAKQVRKPAFEAPKDLRSEEDVKIKYLVPYLERKGYKQDCIEFNKAIEVQEGRKQKTIYADAVVYTTSAKTAPLIVCETKPPSEILSKVVKEQAISYARLLPRIAPLALITNGAQSQVFQTLSKNRIGELPERRELRDDFVTFVVSAEMQELLRTEAKHELFIIDDVQSFKTILRACHDEIRNNEGFDATTAFDEMSKVLFCKMYEERHHPETGNRFRTAIFDETLRKVGVNVVQQVWDETKRDTRFVGLFESEGPIVLKDRTIRKIISLFENYDLSLTAFDVKGEAFEFFLGETFTGGLGEFFTPRNVVEFMVDAVDPKIGQKIVDPFCGTGGFLIYAFEVVSEKIRLQEFSDEEKAKWRLELSNRCIFGTDWKERTTLACKMNMIVHGDGSAGILLHHGLINVPGKIEEGEFNLCITNPPFGSTENEKTVLEKYVLGAGRNSQDRLTLAIERSIRLVRPGGTIAIIVIDGVLNNDRTRYARDYIRQNTWVRSVVSLPAVTFEGYHARAKTSILVLEKKQTPDEEGHQDRTFMAVVENSGYAPNGDPVPGNELPDVLLDWIAFKRDKVSHIHKSSWVTTLADRMDAEYYWKRPLAEKPSESQVTAIAQTAAEYIVTISNELTNVQQTISSAFANLEAVPISLSELFERTSDIERIERDTVYRLLGVKWWGCGTFIREEKLGKFIKATRLNRVSAGQLVYNRLFAFRGSFAIVPTAHDGAHASSEFPTFKIRQYVREAQLVTEYVVHCLNSPQYLAEVDRDSTGSTKTSRNRYKDDRFLRMHVAIPRSIEQMKTLVSLLSRANVLRAQQIDATERVEQLNTGIARMLPLIESFKDTLRVETVEILRDRPVAPLTSLSQIQQTPTLKKRKGPRKK